MDPKKLPRQTDFDRLFLEARITAASEALLAQRQQDGHWRFELEADATIPSEYVLLVHYLGEAPDEALERKIGTYLRRRQGTDGGWPLVHGGGLDVSATVKAYFALKMMGDDPDAEHMRRAREAILERGGAETANVFTRILLALYGILPWRAVPQMPVEIMLAPRWFPFHLSKISYWARTVIVPLLVLQAIRPSARNPRGVRVDELFVASPETVGLLPRAPHQSRGWYAFFDAVDGMLRRAEPFLPSGSRRRAVEAAIAFVTERLNGENGLGAIFPAMVNAVMMFDALGYEPGHPDRAIARASVEKLLLLKDDEAYCQPCLSPVWDTALASQALIEVGDKESLAAARQGLNWLVARQEREAKGDWAARRPHLQPGGWAFQYVNPHYPDLDDTAVIVMAMDRARKVGNGTDGAAYNDAIARASQWIKGMQSRNGGWAAFDADNTHHHLDNIPFADHGAMLDPPSPDLTARCVSMLSQLGETPATSPAMMKGIDYLLTSQRDDGSWFGRWGVNYIYGTWSALSALNAAGFEPEEPPVQRAASWLLSIQNGDGGWGEHADSYKLDYRGYERAPSTASQTAWALLGLMAAGRGHMKAVENGVEYLLSSQSADGLWNDDAYTGTGFPRVFYLRYHGYPKYFPLWALARYRNLRATNSGRVHAGM